MVRRVTPSQYKSLMQQRVRKANQAIDKFNRERKKLVAEINSGIRKYNDAVRRKTQAHKNAVAQYNRAISAYNAQVRSNRAKLAQQAAALQARPTTKYVTIKASAVDLWQRYEVLADQDATSVHQKELVHLAEVEIANSANVAEKLLDDTPSSDAAEEEPSGILMYLSDLSMDLLDRWKGALFALSPENTEASRHFCTSAREIFTEILERWATDEEVIAADPSCTLTPQGKPTRRSKIQYLLRLKGADSPEMVGFVEADIDDVIRLFGEFNEATHGVAGKFGYARLQAIRKRVEGGIMFLATIAA